MAIEQHGRLWDVIAVASGVAISMKGVSGVTFIGTAVTDPGTFTVTTSATYDGTFTDANVVYRYYTSTSQAGAAAWTVTDLTGPGDSPTDAPTCAAGSAITFFIDAASLPAGAQYVKVTASGSGSETLTAIVGDLNQPEDPSRLALRSGASS